IHWWSPVASANASMRSCETSIQLDGPNSAPGSSSVATAPPYDTCRPRVARPCGEHEHELAVVEPAFAGGAVKREERVDAAHVARVVEVGGAVRLEPELGDERTVHRRLHVDPAEVADVGKSRVAPLERAARRGDEVREAHAVEALLHLRGVGDVEEAVAAVRGDAAAGRHLDLQRVRAVRDAVAAEQLVARPVADEQSGNRTVAEVEHEPRPLVAVVEEI